MISRVPHWPSAIDAISFYMPQIEIIKVLKFNIQVSKTSGQSAALLTNPLFVTLAHR